MRSAGTLRTDEEASASLLFAMTLVQHPGDADVLSVSQTAAGDAA